MTFGGDRPVRHWYDVRRQFLQSEFDPHGGWCFFYFTHLRLLFTTNDTNF